MATIATENSQRSAEGGAQPLILDPTPRRISPRYRASLCGTIEQSLKALQGYDVMALELIQNADDAGASTLRIDARDDALIIWNDAQFSRCSFSAEECDWVEEEQPARPRVCNFHAISEMGARSKMGSEQIGRFGIGFVSVYQVTDQPVIRSSGTEMRLNPLLGSADIADLPDAEGSEFELAWAFERSRIRQELNGTVCPPDVADKVATDIAAALPRSLLFLRSLERVEVLRQGRTVLSVGINRSERQVELAIEPDGVTQRWILLRRDAGDLIAGATLLDRYPDLRRLRRSTRVDVAIPADGLELEGVLYAYLPTRQPSGMPLHINADFFPHASRQQVVLDGQGHERFWNEALLATAAAIVGENFALLKEQLGAPRLWELGSAAFKLSGKGAFAPFWPRFSSAAMLSASVMTSAGRWATPSGVQADPADIGEAELEALTSIGVPLLDPALRPAWNALQAVGVRGLSIATVRSRLIVLDGQTITPSNRRLRPLWAAVEALIPSTLTLPARAVVSTLLDVPFLLDHAGRPRAAQWLRHVPGNLAPELLGRALPDLGVPHPHLAGTPKLNSLIRTLDLDEFAAALAGRVADSESARALADDGRAVSAVYRMLTGLWREDQPTKARQLLQDAPIFRRSDGSLVEPRRAQLPSRFRDPTGYLELVDTRAFPNEMARFATRVLRVQELTLAEYVEHHLADALERELTREQYRLLVQQLADNRFDLQGQRDTLRSLPLVRNRAGAFVPASDCYQWTAQLEALLGQDPANWLDPTWLPASADVANRFRDMLVSDLGMPTAVSASHLVQRIEYLAGALAPRDIGTSLSHIFRHALERWPYLDQSERETLAELRDVDFLPGRLQGETDPDRLYSPGEVYRSTRAVGFDSQVPIIDLQRLRATDRAATELLDLLEVPEVPETGVIVDHLLHCIENDRPPNVVTYSILSERLRDGGEVGEIDRLRGAPFIWGESARFLTADAVFWTKPPVGGRWHQANPQMYERRALYEHLGVAEAPEPRHYATLLLQIADDAGRTELDVSVHRLCLTQLAEDLHAERGGAGGAIDDLCDESCLLALDGRALWPGEAYWLDSEAHLAPFGPDLDDIVVPRPDGEPSMIRSLFRRLGAKPLSSAVDLRLASQPAYEVDGLATATIRERSELLVRLAPTREARSVLREMLSNIELRRVSALSTVAELVGLAAPVVSEPVPAHIFLSREEYALYVAAQRVGIQEWTAIARELLHAVAPLCPNADLKALAATAQLALVLPTLEDAAEALAGHGFAPLSAAGDIPEAEELAAAPEQEEEEDKSEANQRDASVANAEGEELHGNEAPETPQGQPDVDRNGPRGANAQQAAASEQPATTDGAQAGSGWPGQAQACGTAETGSGDIGKSDGTARSDADGADDAYHSKVGSGRLDGQPGGRPGPGEQKGSATGPGDNLPASVTREGFPARSRLPGDDAKSREERGERSRSRSRMRSYVSQEKDAAAERPDTKGEWDDANDLVDAAAVAAVLAYEQVNGRSPEEQPHTNPGFDVLSSGPDGARRLIEVKGINGDWDGFGIKLSATQYRFAREHGEEFWLYVVENALEETKRHVRPLRNPFSRVDEYWFDGEWRKACEAGASTRDIQLRVGARVQTEHFGRGVIIEIDSRGRIKQAKVRCDDQRTRLVPVHRLEFIG